MNEEKVDLDQLIEKVVTELKRRFPTSEISVKRNNHGSPIAYVDGMKVIDLERIAKQLQNLPASVKKSKK